MIPRRRRTAFAVASPSSPVPAGKKKAAETVGHRALAVPPPLRGSVVGGARAEVTGIGAVVGGCSWRASIGPPVAAGGF